MSFMINLTVATVWILTYVVTPGGTPAETQLVGDWKGTSLCTVKNSPCHDETVVYHISGIVEKAGWFSIKADKIVNGKPEYMGTLDCSYASATHLLKCEMERGTWRFTLEQDKMTGTLHLTDGTLYRRINVQKEH